MNNKILSVAVLPIILSACGGSGGSAPDPATPAPKVNQAPQALDLAIKDINAGEIQIGDELSANYNYKDADNDAEGDSLVRWLRDDIAITNATNKNYVLTFDDAGKAITFEVTPVAVTGEKQGVAVVSSAINVANQFAPTVNDVTITTTSNGPWVGTEVVGSYTYKDNDGDEEGETSLRWLTDNVEVATGTERYQLKASDINKALVFEVTPKAKTGILVGKSVASSTVNATVQTVPSVKDVTITTTGDGPWVGTEVVGSYTYEDNENDQEGGSVLRWLLDGVEVATATTRYTLQDSDTNKSLVFEVTPKAKTGMLQGIKQASAAVVIKSNSLPEASELWVTANGGIKVGTSLTGQYIYTDADNDAEGDSQYRWLRNNVAIANATQKTYILQKEDAGKNISFTVTPIATSGITKGLPQASRNISVNALPRLTNFSFSAMDVYPGQRISFGYIYNDAENDAEGIHKFRWYRDGVLIPNSPTWRYYTLTNDDAGKNITVKIIPMAKTGSIEGFEITPTVSLAVNSNTPPEARNIVITDENGGELYPGDVVRVSYTYYDAEGDAEGDTNVVWKFQTNNSSGYIPNTSGNNTYVVSSRFVDGQIFAQVTPKAQTGALSNDPAYSNELDVVLPDTTAPVLTQQTPIVSPTINPVVEYTFHSSEKGTLVASGRCVNPSVTNVVQGNNTITFGPLEAGVYSDCVIKVTDAASNASLPLSITEFEVKRPDPIHLTLLMDLSGTIIRVNDESDLDIMVSDQKSCSFFEPDQCTAAEMFNTSTQSFTSRLSEYNKGYLRLKQNGMETVNQYISTDGFKPSLKQQVSFYHDRFWMITDNVSIYLSRGVFSSEDGINWIKETPNEDIHISGEGHSQAVYQDKLHLMNGRSHVVFDANADEGEQWEKTLISSEEGIDFSQNNTAYVFNDTLYVLSGHETSQLFSYDGSRWKKLSDEVTVENESTVIGGGDFDVVEMNGKLFMFGLLRASSSPNVLRSNDGVTWHRVSVTGDAFPSSNRDVEAVKFGNTLVAAFYNQTGLYGGQTLYHSNDGQNWSRVYQGQALRYQDGQEWIAAKNKIYVFGGGRKWPIVMSNDTWVSGDGIGFQTLSTVAKAPNLSHHRVVVFDDHLWSFSARGGNDQAILQVMKSQDGVRWNEVHASHTGTVSLDVEFEIYTWNNKLFVINGFGVDTIYSSSDGVNWNDEGSLPFNTGLKSVPEVMNNGDHLIMVGGVDASRSYRSMDGINWTEQANTDNGLPPQLARHQLVKTNSDQWMSIGGSPKIIRPDGGSLIYPVDHVYTSNDNGVNWQKNETAKLPNIMSDHQAINYQGSIWLYDKNKIYQFDESTSQWLSRGTTPNHTEGENHQVVEFKDKLWMLGGDKNPNQLYVSEDAVNWYSMKPVTLEFP